MIRVFILESIALDVEDNLDTRKRILIAADSAAFDTDVIRNQQCQLIDHSVGSVHCQRVAGVSAHKSLGPRAVSAAGLVSE